jgi:Flp pilus assembly protein TadD
METTDISGNNSATSCFLLSKAYCIKGTFAADEGNFREALEYFNKAIEVDPSNHVTYFNRATIKVNMGDIEGARNDFYTCVKLMK